MNSRRIIYNNGRAWQSMAFAAMLLGPGILHNPAPAQGASSYQFQVPTTIPWFDTGLDISAGSRLDLTASGIIAYGLSPGQTVDPNGIGPLYDGTTTDPVAVLPNTIVVSLIGKVGGTETIGTGTLVPEGAPGHGPGFVGSSYSEVIPTSGRLFLGFNDELSAFWDNSGSFSIEASITPVPEPSVLALLAFGVWALAGTLRAANSETRRRA